MASLSITDIFFKGQLHSKNNLSSNERAEKNAKKWALTDLNAPNGSRDISFQSQEFEQDGSRHFGGFQPHFHINMTSRTQSCKTKKKLKVRYLRSLLFDLFEILQAVRTWQRDLSWFQISLLWQPKSTQLSFIEKTKVYYLRKMFFKNNLKQYSWIITAHSIILWRKIDETLFLLWENNSLLFLNKGLLFLL